MRKVLLMHHVCCCSTMFCGTEQKIKHIVETRFQRTSACKRVSWRRHRCPCLAFLCHRLCQYNTSTPLQKNSWLAVFFNIISDIINLFIVAYVNTVLTVNSTVEDILVRCTQNCVHHLFITSSCPSPSPSSSSPSSSSSTWPSPSWLARSPD